MTAQLPHVLEVISHSPEQTARLGRRLGDLLAPGDLVLLTGQFGAGKTQFIRGVVQGLGSADLVTSPSFVLVNEYTSGPAHRYAPILHADLYRIADPAEVVGLDLDDPDARAIVLVEWAEHGLLARAHLAIQLRHLTETKRILRFEPHGVRYIDLIDTFRRTSFA